MSREIVETMTSGPAPPSSRRLRAPQENGTAVVDPPFAEAPALLAHNRRPDWSDFQLYGKSAALLRNEARSEMVAEARQWTAAYRDVAFLPPQAPETMLLAGHQPQMFHPGVWLKNFTLGRLAQRLDGLAVNLIVDSDVARPTALKVPGGTLENPEAAWIPFDLADPAVPYEERLLEDAALFASFARRVQDRLRPLVPRPLFEEYWPMVLQRQRATGRWGAAVAQARHQLEAAWGLQTLEVPQSVICDLPAFRYFTAFLLGELPRFLPVHNAAVTECRRRRRIRSAAHPVPDLAVDADWHEAPFWVWTADDPQRRRLFVRRVASEIILSDRRQFDARVPRPDCKVERTVEALAELRRGGVKIRSRALITTLWARLFLGDLFLHGIGGAHYEKVTDQIIEGFFSIPPPGFMVLSGTLHLPVPCPALQAADSRSIRRQLRELTYHPERFLNEAFSSSEDLPPESLALVEEKRRWIATPQNPENARIRCQSIRHANEQLQSYLADLWQSLLRQQTAVVALERAQKILRWRQYAFCLYPEEALRGFLERLLAEM